MHLSASGIFAIRAPLVLLLLCACQLAGCGSVPSFEKKGEAGPTPVSAAQASGTEQVYFAGEGNLKIHESPSAGSKVVGQLALHQKVLRREVSKGYAHIRTPDDSLRGWVDNARLIWRLPSGTPPAEAAPSKASTPTAAPESRATEAPATESGAESAAPEDSTTAGAAPPVDVMPTAPAAPAAAPSVAPPTEAPEKPAPSVFDPI